MVKGRWKTTPLLLATALAAGGVHGETVYRCETENDVVYQDFPCDGPGEEIEVPTDPPDPQEVQRTQRRQEEMRELIEDATRQRLRREALETMRAPEVIIIQPAVEDDGGGDDDGDDDDDVRILNTCPLGLGNCAKPDDPVFRRPKPDRNTPAAPLGLSRDRNGTPAQTSD